MAKGLIESIELRINDLNLISFKGTYQIYGYNFNFDRLPPYFEGHYMLDSRFYKNNVFLNGYRLYGTIIKT